MGLWSVLRVTADCWTFKITKVRRFCLRLPTKGVYYVCCVTRDIKRRTQKLGHDILRYVSKFRRSEPNNYFFIGKKKSRKHFDENNIAQNCISGILNTFLVSLTLGRS